MLTQYILMLRRSPTGRDVDRGDAVGIRPPVPPDDDRGGFGRDAPRGPGTPADRASGPAGAGDPHGTPVDPAGATGDVHGGTADLDPTAPADLTGDADPTARPADLTADQLHAGGPGAASGGPVLEWRVDKRLTWTKLVLAVLFLAGPWVVSAGALSRLVGLVAGAGLAVAGLRDVMAPVRLRADPAGVRVVSGFAGHRELRWQDLERVRLDSRSHLGIRSELLEIDAGESLHFFSRYDLGEPPVEALDRIRRLRGVGGR
jgi:hypothetical protein